MIKTVIVPDTNTLYVTIPNSYIGKEIEVLLYSKDEIIEGKPKNNVSRFKGILNNEEAAQYHAYLNQARNEWNRDI